MKLVPVLMWVLGTMVLNAQKVIEKKIPSEGVHTFVLTPKEAYKITVHTATVKEAVVKAWFEGEYTNELFITTDVQKDKIEISVDFRPLYIKEDDKLAAHKSVSAVIDLVLPEGNELIVNGADTESYVSGKFSNLQLFVHNGNCFLDHLSGNGTVATFGGNIIVRNYAGEIKAVSDYGTVNLAENKKSSDILSIHTVKGNISVNTNK